MREGERERERGPLHVVTYKARPTCNCILIMHAVSVCTKAKLPISVFATCRGL